MAARFTSIVFAAGAILTLANTFPAAAPREVPDFAMLDSRGRYFQLRRNDAKVVVLFFTANGCPVARQSISRLKQLQEDFAEKGVRIWMVNSNSGDDRASVRKEAEEFNYGTLPVLLDETQGVAAMLGVQRTGTAVCIDTKTFAVIYQGAIDDQLVEGAQKPKPTQIYLREALAGFLVGKPVANPRTAARGCIITIPKEQISYSKQVAPILAEKCFGCHSSGNIGPIKFANYEKVHGVADMIQEVVLARRMPPWHADRHYGAFVNDSSLTVDEARTLLRWIEQGAKKDDGEDLLKSAVPPSSDWVLGKPDVIVSLPEVEKIPGDGRARLSAHQSQSAI